MFWLILAIIFGTLSKIRINRYCKNVGQYSLSTYEVIYIVIAVLSTLIVFIEGATGIADYPNLVKKLGQIEALQNRIKDIKESVYEYKKDGNFVAGSIENYQQSTNLSKYITDLATKEADYKGELQKCKAYKEVFPLHFFGPGWAISKRIYDLPMLE